MGERRNSSQISPYQLTESMAHHEMRRLEALNTSAYSLRNECAEYAKLSRRKVHTWLVMVDYGQRHSWLSARLSTALSVYLSAARST
jgi:hypothetical protein